MQQQGNVRVANDNLGILTVNRIDKQPRKQRASWLTSSNNLYNQLNNNIERENGGFGPRFHCF